MLVSGSVPTRLLRPAFQFQLQNYPTNSGNVLDSRQRALFTEYGLGYYIAASLNEGTVSTSSLLDASPERMLRVLVVYKRLTTT